MRHPNNKHYTLEEVNCHITEKTHQKGVRVDFDGNKVKMCSDRYKLFDKSHVCVCCDKEGLYYALDKNEGVKHYHFNLYGVDSSGKELLFTKDHILPKSRGGKNTLSNYQTMCTECNLDKGNSPLKMYLCWKINKESQIEFLGVAQSHSLAKVICCKSGDRFMPLDLSPKGFYTVGGNFDREVEAVESSESLTTYNVNGNFVLGYTNACNTFFN